ncbi:MAG: hypothetical protein ACLQLG_14100 [Thermoguttaceae bacterium]
MKSPQQESPFSEALTRDHWDVPIRVRLLPYVEFTAWLDEELEKLVERWARKMPPRAGLPRRR